MIICVDVLIICILTSFVAFAHSELVCLLELQIVKSPTMMRGSRVELLQQAEVFLLTCERWCQRLAQLKFFVDNKLIIAHIIVSKS